MTATHFTADPPAASNGGTVHVIATSLEGTREALEAATALARGLCGRVVVFLQRASIDLNIPDQNISKDERDQALRRLTDSYTPRPNVLACVCKRAIDVVQLFQSPGMVVIGGKARWWWPTAEQRLAEDLTRLGCHVTFVHVPRGRFVPPLVAAAREQARQTAKAQLDNPDAR
jgi:hypothetical protein